MHQKIVLVIKCATIIHYEDSLVRYARAHAHAVDVMDPFANCYCSRSTTISRSALSALEAKGREGKGRLDHHLLVSPQMLT